MSSTAKTQLATAQDDLARYQQLIEAITDYAIYMLDPTGVIVSWNPGAQRFKGYNPQEIIGQHFSRFYTPEDKATGLPRRALEIAAREGKFESEGWRVRKDGTRFWAHVIIDPIYDGERGIVTGFAKITRDLTQRNAAADRLRRSEEQFRILVQGVTDYAIYMLDPEGIVTNWNLGAERIKGYKAAEIVGQHFSRFYTDEEREAGMPQRALEAALKEGRHEREGWRVRKDGSRFWAHVIIDPIWTPEGELAGYAKITRDITERKQAHEALERTHQALVQTQKMEAIGQLTGGVAHDFNNLLMAVLGSLELLRKRLPDDPGMKRLVDNAILGAQRGASLTQRMLAFARRQDIATGPVPLAALLNGMKELLGATLGATAAVELRFAPDIPAVIADENQLSLAILNLSVNARDAMPDGGTVTITAEEVALRAGNELGLGVGQYVRLAVSDTGQGMDAETLARATEPFFTTKGVGKGTGLGLSMVQGMAEQLGGKFVIASKKGQGTRAEMWLRVAGEGMEVAEARKPASDMARGRKLKILAVDDDHLVLFNTAEMLRDLGHMVWEAGSGEAALEVLAARPAELVITDQVMPRMTGTQLIDKIRKTNPEVPAILATGYAETPADLDPAIVRLKKPFTQDELRAAIEKIS
ncbi:MAG TPA: PAS domain S-box protein [Rhizomicrobium sp.]|nr:PAS domain S-box protein [Rhizomicrobium sp.]